MTFFDIILHIKNKIDFLFIVILFPATTTMDLDLYYIFTLMCTVAALIVAVARFSSRQPEILTLTVNFRGYSVKIPVKNGNVVIKIVGMTKQCVGSDQKEYADAFVDALHKFLKAHPGLIQNFVVIWDGDDLKEGSFTWWMVFVRAEVQRLHLPVQVKAFCFSHSETPYKLVSQQTRDKNDEILSTEAIWFDDFITPEFGITFKEVERAFDRLMKTDQCDKLIAVNADPDRRGYLLLGLASIRFAHFYFGGVEIPLVLTSMGPLDYRGTVTSGEFFLKENEALWLDALHKE